MPNQNNLKVGLSMLTNTAYVGKINKKGVGASKQDVTKGIVDLIMLCAESGAELSFQDEDYLFTMKFTNPERGVFKAELFSRKEVPDAESK